ncbi:hypothetical protein B7P43_G14238 [Cryptotermes secundus]|uniref:Uncharacterized protein n=1 Tax=Cryptotermes secundus TaxID=105785 RepID=A0A2J7RBI2_9NEOP|nr:hypothetical protein B7P43_G14238 [Cryptotermes secundus]
MANIICKEHVLNHYSFNGLFGTSFCSLYASKSNNNNKNSMMKKKKKNNNNNNNKSMKKW